MATKSSNVAMSIQIPPELHDAIRRLSAIEERTMTSFIRYHLRMVVQDLESSERKEGTEETKGG